jgi:hypothetical protein
MTTIADLFGHTHIVELCQFDDVPMHFKKLKDMIPEEDPDEFCKRMDECIDAGTAFALSDDSCFLYYKNTTPEFATGVALHGKGEPTKLLALFAAVFGELDTATFKMDFTMHPGKFVKEYRTLISPVSVMRMHSNNYPLVVRVDKLKEKIGSLYNLKGITPHECS